MKNENKEKIKKEKVTFLIDKEVITDFRKLIQEKYEIFERGIFSNEAETALRSWIDSHKKAQTLMQTPNINLKKTPKINLAFEEVKRYLLSEFYYTELTVVPFVVLKKAIAQTRGSDPRTIKKWMEIFYKAELIKPISMNTCKIVG